MLTGDDTISRPSGPGSPWMRQAAAAPWAAPLGNGWPGHSGGGGRGAWSREVRAAIYHSAAPMGPKKPFSLGSFRSSYS
eukprot:SAG31_NODE_297_length_18175_cov_68.266659_17_plen_79_part_00